MRKSPLRTLFSPITLVGFASDRVLDLKGTSLKIDQKDFSRGTQKLKVCHLQGRYQTFYEEFLILNVLYIHY